MNTKAKVLFILLAIINFNSVSNAALMFIFDMNDMDVNNDGTTVVSSDNTAGTPTPTLTLAGTGIVSDGQDGVSFTDASGANHDAEEAAAWSSGVNDGSPAFTLNFDSTGFQDLQVRYDYRSTSTGAPSAQVGYRIGNAGEFTNFGTDTYTRDSTFYEIQLDFSAVGSLDNTSNVYIQWILSPGSGSGTFRLDNLEVSATAVPEPHEYAMVAGLMLVGFAVFRHRRQRSQALSR